LDADTEETPGHPKSIGPERKASAIGARVLIVDDAQDTREVYALFLRDEGFQVAVAEDGVTGLTFAQQHPLDIIILDLMMPRMDGFEVTRRLRADDRTRNIPIIIFSGFEKETDTADAIAAGADVCCIKPCLPETLLGEINRLLLRRRAA
jgi:DNA-binding response OmpR family regulator